MKSGMIIHPEELSLRWIDRLADAGIGTLGIHPRGGELSISTLTALLEDAKTQKYRGLIDYAHSRGLEIEYELHAAGYLMPRDLFAEHPEYFRMNADGVRTSDYNFCVSEPDALEHVARRAAELAQALYGSSNRFYFWMDDGHDLKCHCPHCARLSASDQQLIALNAMLSEIRKYIPDAHMAYLAYMDTVITPTSVTAMDGIFLEYAPFEKYTAKGENAAELIRQEREMMVPLMRFFDREQKKLLEYWYDNSLFSHWTRPPRKFVLDAMAMRSEITGYKADGFDIISTFACFLGDDYEQLHGDFDITPFAECVASPESDC